MWLLVHLFGLSARWNGSWCSPQQSLAPPVTAFTRSKKDTSDERTSLKFKQQIILKHAKELFVWFICLFG